MNGAGSKAKGGEFERAVCKRLSLWMTRGLRDDLFWRSAMSGGRATVRFNRGARNRTQAGDISAIDPIGERLTGQFLIECKAYKSLDLPGLFYPQRSGGIVQFWDKCRKDAFKAGLSPMLVAKQNGFPILVVVDQVGEARVGLTLPRAYYPAHEASVYFFEEDFLKRARRP